MINNSEVKSKTNTDRSQQKFYCVDKQFLSALPNHFAKLTKEV